MIGRLGPTFRISVSLALLSVSLLLLGDLLGLIPNSKDIKLTGRAQLAESLAIQLSHAATAADVEYIDGTLQAIVERNDDILSAALRRIDGVTLAMAGDHSSYWVERSDRHSTPDHILVPILRGDERWGTVELAFSPISGLGADAVASSELFRLCLFVAVFSIFIFGFFMRRTLRVLNPAAVIPQHVQAALDTLTEGVLILDEKKRIVLANASFGAKVDTTPEDLVGRKVDGFDWSRWPANGEDKPLPWDTDEAEGSTGVGMMLNTSATERLTLIVNVAPIFDEKKKRKGALVTFDDVTMLESKNNELQLTLAELRSSQNEIHRQNRELQVLATRDPLTGCLNRRAFFADFAPLFRQARKTGQPLSCIMADIDHFKSVNDRFGHAAGDAIIKTVADILGEGTRKQDLVGRYGGEEFALVLPDMDLDAATRVAECIRGSVAARAGEAIGPGHKVTASLGIATLAAESATPEALIDLADKALYVAKESGRDRVTTWSESAAVRSQTDTAQSPVVRGDDDDTRAIEITRLRQEIKSLQGSLPTAPGRHDPITNLPTRTAFDKQVNDALIQARRQDRLVAVVSLDVNMFRRTGDALGHVFSDRLISAAAACIQSMLRSTDAISLMEPGTSANLFRMSGDEFGILLSDLTDVESVTFIVKRLFETLAAPLVVDGDEIYLTSTAGISLFPYDGDDAERLITNAHLAHTHAKRRGTYYQFQFFSADMNQASTRQIQLEAELSRALKEEQFSLEYQPKVALDSGQIVGVEALLRWQHPELGSISPVEFIPIAEHTGHIVAIGEWVMSTAFSRVQSWREEGFDNARVAVNLSAAQFRQGDLVETVRRLLAQTGIPGGCVEFELTETMIMDDVEAAIHIMRALHELGANLTIDDFGTGYSSLEYLKRFPIDTVKIDRSFLLGITGDENDMALVNGIIAMSHSMGLDVVAEGVETVQQLELLQAAQCDMMQGYLFSRPVAPEKAAALLRNGVQLEGVLSGRRAEPGAAIHAV